MGTPNNELLIQLRGAISNWTDEVGTAQRGLSQQIDGANTQLTRLLAVLHERQQLTTALARSNEELDRLKQTMQQGQLPAGAMTRYTVSPTPAADAATRELEDTISRLQTAVQSWTSQVAHSQGGLLEQFATANRQLTQLLEILTEPAGAAPVPSAPTVENLAQIQELEQLRHENRILSSEVHALNIEMETVRREQENFATANLASETERVVKHRSDMERLEKALTARDAELKEQQQAFEVLSHEADGLRKEAARLQISEDRLQLAAEHQRHETAEHVSALSALSREMEALRRAFLGEDVQLATQESDISEDDENPEGAEALDRAEARIAVLESQLTQQEIGREEVAVLEERIEALKEQLAVLERRPTTETLLSLEAHAASLEAALAEAPEKEEHAVLQAELEALRASRFASPESLVPNEPEVSTVERVSELASRIAELESELAVLSSRPTAEELAASAGHAAELESRIVELECELADFSTRPAVYDPETSEEQASELASRITALESELSDLSSRPTAEELAASAEHAAELASRIAELESELADLSSRPTAEELVASAEHASELAARIATLETEVSELSCRPTAEELAASAEHAAELASRIAELESELSDLSSRPTAEEFAASAEHAAELASRIAELKSELLDVSSRPTAEELAASAEHASELASRIAELESELADLTSRPTAEELAASVEHAAELASRIAELESELSDLSSRPTAEELAAHRERADTLELALEQLRANSNAATDMASEATALRDQLVMMQTLLEELDGRPEAGVLEDAQDRVVALEEEVQALKERLAAASESQVTLLADERAGLQRALSAMESELAAMKRREEETMSTARTLLEEMETHRTYEAAQATALSQSRSEAARLQDALIERQQQVAVLSNALAAAEAAREALAVELGAATQALAVMQQDLDALQTTYTELREQSAAEQAELEATARERDARIAVLEADLPGHAESLMKASALEEALRAACARVEELETLALEAEAAEIEPDPELTAALAGQEAEVRRLTAEIAELRDAVQTAVKQIEELEQKLEHAASAHAELQALHADLNGRLEEILAERDTLVSVEAEQRAVVEAARKEADAALSAALEQEQALAAAMAALDEKSALMAALESEKETLSEESQDRNREIREAMAQMSQVLHERDELTEELEAEKTRRERIFAGSAGAGKSAAEALELKEERARQQEILLSELTQPGESRSLGDILVYAGILSREQLSLALDEQQKDPTQLLGTILIERDYTTDDAIAQAVACQLEKPVVNPMEVYIHKDALAALSRDLCTWHVCIPLRITPDRLVVAMANPLDESAILKLRDVSQREITPVVATPSHIMGAIDNCYGTF